MDAQTALAQDPAPDMGAWLDTVCPAPAATAPARPPVAHARRAPTRTDLGPTRVPTRTARLLDRRATRRVVAVAALIAALAVARAVWLPVYVVPSASMEPTLPTGSLILAVRAHEARRGDVVVFSDELGWLAAGKGSTLVKRVIGVAGDRVVASGGTLTVNGQVVEEPYRDPRVAADRDFDVVVAPGTVWVLGDDRARSADSSYHGEGVPTSALRARVVAVVWPPGAVRAVGR